MKIGLGVLLAVLGSATSTLAQPPPALNDAAIRQQLADQFLIATDHYALEMEVFEKELGVLSPLCAGKPCSAELQQAISDTIKDLAPEYRRRMSQTYAEHLSEEQLRAAIKFAISPEGQAIAQAQRGMTDEMAALGQAMSQGAREGVSKRFCPTHPEICVVPPSKAGPGTTVAPK